MITIPEQHLLSTKLDAHGERLSKEELYSLYKGLPAELSINDEHDLSRPPVAVARNFQFVSLDEHDWAISAEVSVEDENTLKNRGGFSFSWLAASYTAYPDRQADIEILFNPRIFDAEFCIGFASKSDDTTNIVARELKQKGLDPDAILIIQFATTAAVSGFLGKPASDLYDRLMRWLKDGIEQHKNDKQQNVKLHLLVPGHLNPLKATILLEIPSEHIENMRVGSLSYQDAVEIAKAVPYAKDVKKIVISTSGSPPVWQLQSYQKSTGLIVKI
jgi:hypothetical protein